MTSVPDSTQRERALTDLDATLLVEAAAGTGKTSLLAGRVAVLLAAGRSPASIAAITFTERAAAELRGRVDKFAALLIDGTIPKDLEPAFRAQTLSEAQVEALSAARAGLGELTASTIHSFCLTILQSYAVEARIDPGAAVMDADQTDLAFDAVFDAWLNRRLGHDGRRDDPIVVMAAHDPNLAVKTLKSLARFRRAHPEARPLPPPRYADTIHELIDAVAEYRRWISRVAAPDDAIADVLAFEELANMLAPASEANLDFAQLWLLVHPTSDALLPRGGHVVSRYKNRVGAWSRSAGKADGEAFSATGKEHYECCALLFADSMGAIADALLARFFGETDELVAEFEAFKRNAAVLDFDDILVRTRALLRSDEKVRVAVASRYRHILVDEYQDTDPLQSEILFLIAGESGGAEPWHNRRLRPGALFVVGDPKQAIYRFRRADLKSYLRARATIEAQFPGNVLQISANFRSGKSILQHVDRVFADRLAKQQGGYAALDATVVEDPSRIQSIAKLSYDVPPDSYVNPIRDLEAQAVAELCARLVGNVWVRRSNGKVVRAEPGDIALLAPRRTQLWRYERALEERGLPVASQAGKNLYRRQESQDVVSLVGALADSRDTLALGAVLRGPLVGLTEAELLDITSALREQDEGAVLDLQTDLSRVTHPVAHRAIHCLQKLWRKRRGTTPYALLAEAVEQLRIIPTIAARGLDQQARALGNLHLFLERARRYQVRGLKQLAIDLAAEWESEAATDEAPSDYEGDSIDIVTVHKAKGLEWPIVVPINFVTMPDGDDDFFFGSVDNSVHWTLGDVVSSTLDAAIAADRAEAADERERLLYVACTRALDLLVLPAPSWAPDGGWARFLDLGQAALEEVRYPTRQPSEPVSPPTPNGQSAAIYADEHARIVRLNPRIEWRRPSLADIDRELLDRATLDVAALDESADTEPIVVGAGVSRGVLLHKLMEELLTGLLLPDLPALEDRASALIGQLGIKGPERPDPAELAGTALRTFSHKELQPYIGKLEPEIPLYGARSDTILVSARADAIAFEANAPIAAFDWKSDVAPTPDIHAGYVSQLLAYLELVAAEKGAIVYMTSGEFHWVHHRSRASNDLAP
ncbi:UvrD-helicase domain-containing protein [Mesorhizobium sp. ORM16]|uniref:UvrD-helicase domain-containing protein n=1 Tax=Mesorhizobium sp. ORM16 TaxID=3376989 RepID=UPI003857399E